MLTADPTTLGPRPSVKDRPPGMPIVALGAFALVASITGRLLAPALFGAASGIERGGSWTLQVVDRAARDTGMITSWDLAFR